MIVSRTPFRISFFGGGSDYPQWYTKNGGRVLGATIDKYCWITVRKSPPFGKPYKVVYSKVEESNCVGEIQHPAIRETLADLEYPGPTEIIHSSDLPARSGVGSSSAFVVSLIRALTALYPEDWEEFGQGYWSKWRVAEEAIHIEQNILKENVGSQDQILCSFGGLNVIEFSTQGRFSIHPVFDNKFDEERCTRVLEDRLLLFYTGIQRTASDVASGYTLDLAHKYESIIYRMIDIVNDGTKVLQNIARGGDPDIFGILLDQAWNLKRKLKGVSTPEIDLLYNKASEMGSLGGKIMGAGGGGFLLLYVPLDKQKNVRDVLKGLVEVPFKFEYNGSVIAYNGENK